MTITIPKKGYAEKQAAIVVKCGGLESPSGIAHFLEHKMFEDAEINFFEAFAKNGAMVNAYTHFTHTVYYFSCIDAFDENLELLQRLVSKTHFTNENVEKEKGIILSEIDMYADNPYWQVYTNLHKALFHEMALRQDILGIKESIQTITPAKLQEVYDTFYTPEKMALICVGDFDECRPGLHGRAIRYSDEIRISNDQPLQTPPKFVSTEPAHAKENQIEKNMPVAIPIFQLGFKAISQNTATNIAAATILTDMLAGESSETYAQLYDSGLIDNQFNAEYLGGSYYGIFLFSGTSSNPQAVREGIHESIKIGLDSSRFETIKSKHIGRYLKNLNAISNILTAQADLYTRGQDVWEMANAFQNVRMQDVEVQFAHLLEQNQALSIINPIAS